MAENVELQGLEFEIVSESAGAVKELKSLASSLQKLKKLSENGAGLKKLADDLKTFNDALGGVNGSGISTMANAIATITNSGKRLMTVRGHLQAISDMEFGNLQKAGEAVANIASASFAKQASSSSKEGLPTEVDESMSTPVETETAQLSLRERLYSALNGALNRIKGSVSAVKDGFKGLEKAVISCGGKVGKFVVALPLAPFKALKKQLSSAAKSVEKFTSSLGRIALYRAMRTIISSITTALKEGINNLYQYSRIVGTDFHKSMNQIATDALYIKNSIGSMVAPIINSLAPAFDYLADRIAACMNVLAQFLAKLSGKDVYSKAVKYATNYADAAKSAAQKMKDFVLGIDELNVFNDTKSSSGFSADDYSKMFEEATVSDSIGSFAEQVKQAFSAGQWTELGAILGEKVNESIAAVKWNDIGTTIGTYITGAVQTGYSFLKTVNFNALGEQLIQTVNGILETADFETMGRLFIRKFTAVFDTLLGAIKGLNWGLMGKKFSGFVKGVFQEVADWIGSYNWGVEIKRLGQNLDAAINEMDVAGIAQSLGNILKAVINGAMEIATEIDWGAELQNAIKNFNEFGIQCGEGLKQGFLTFISGIGEWIQTNVTDPILNWFRELFGIHSPSTVFAEMGMNLILGLVQGLTENLYLITDWLIASWESIKEWFTTTWEEVTVSFTNIVSWFNTSVTTPISTHFKNLGTNIGNYFKSAWNTVKSTWTVVTSWFKTTIIEPVRTAFDEMCITVGIFFSDLWETIKAVFGNTYSWFSTNVVDVTVNCFRNLVNGAISLIEGMLNTVIDALNWVIDAVNSVIEEFGGDGFSNVSHVSLPRLAEGGFVDEGQLFIAREAGAEMVGNIGNRTAVANNDQIVQGIAAGVSSANEEEVALLREQNDLLTAILEKSFDIQIGDKDIGQANDRYVRSRGIVTSTGVYANAY